MERAKNVSESTRPLSLQNLYEEASKRTKSVPGFKKEIVQKEIKIQSVLEKEGDLEYIPMVLQKGKKIIKTKKKDGSIVESEEDTTLIRVHQQDLDSVDVTNQFNSLPVDSLLHSQIKQTKVMVCVTMYNEPYYQILQSLAGIYRAYYELVGKDHENENQFSIVIVSDGYSKFHEIGADQDGPTFAESLKEAGLYDERMPLDYIKKDEDQALFTKNKQKYEYVDLDFIKENNEDGVEYETHNLAHCFSRRMTFPDFLEGLTGEQQNDFQIDKYDIHDFMLGDSKGGSCKTQKYVHLPIPVHFVIKHSNRGKIESHLWFFKGFCMNIEPRFCYIIDAGTIPLWDSMSKVIFHMEADPKVGGASGEIEVMLAEKNPDGTSVSFVESIITRSQYVEYKISHYLDKATESLFGFVSVLPGAFSAFRWDAIKGEPLRKFLIGQELTDSKREKYPSCFDANMYLAEDRIMCLEIIAKANESFILKYIPGCKAITDPPNTMKQLIKQRRRWHNGSLFASFHVAKSMCRIWRRKASKCRNLLYMILYGYIILNLIVGLFVVGLFYASFSIFARSIFKSDDCLSVRQTANVLENVYLVFLFFCLIMSCAVNIDWAEWGFRIISIFMGLFTLFMVSSVVIYYDEDETASLNILFILLVLASYFIPLILHCKELRVVDFFKGIVYIILLAPTYINIISLYSISNIHDVTWGSRPVGTQSAAEVSQRAKKMSIDYRNYRAIVLVAWTLANAAVGGIVVLISRSSQNYYIFIVGIVLMIIIGLKLFCSTLHVCQSWCNTRRVKRYTKTRTGKDFGIEDGGVLRSRRFKDNIQAYSRQPKKEYKQSGNTNMTLHDKEDEDEKDGSSISILPNRPGLQDQSPTINLINKNKGKGNKVAPLVDINQQDQMDKISNLTKQENKEEDKEGDKSQDKMLINSKEDLKLDKKLDRSLNDIDDYDKNTITPPQSQKGIGGKGSKEKQGTIPEVTDEDNSIEMRDSTDEEEEVNAKELAQYMESDSD